MIKKLLFAAAAGLVGCIIGSIARKRDDIYDDTAKHADNVVEKACDKIIDILEGGTEMAKDKFEKTVEHVKSVGKMVFGHGIDKEELADIRDGLKEEVRDEFVDKQLSLEKAAKTVGAIGVSGLAVGAVVFIGSIIVKAFIYEKAQTNIDEYYLKYDTSLAN